MTPAVHFMVAFLIYPCFSTIEYSRRNVSCSDIKIQGGFNFSHGCPVGAEVFVSDNEILIAKAELGKPYELLREVVMDNNSVITKECRALKIKCIIPHGIYLEETRLILQPIEGIKKPDPDASSSERLSSGGNLVWIVFFSVIFGIIGIIGIIVLYCRYLSWKREMNVTRRREAATFCGFCTDLVTHCALRKQISCTGCSETGETSSAEVQSAPEPHGSGENDVEQDVHSIVSGSDCKTPHTRSLDRNSSNGGICPTNDAGIIALDDNRAHYHRAMNRKLRDDPGGACYVTGQEFVRADFRGSDVTGEAVPLVDMGGLVQDQVSRCFVALDTDVESRPKMKNVGNN